MPIRESIVCVRNVRRRLLLAGLVTFGGCLGSLSVAVAEDSNASASCLTLPQLFESDTADLIANEDTLLFGEEGATGTSTPIQVKYVIDEPDLTPDNEDADSKKTDDKDSKETDDKAGAAKEPAEKPKTELNVKPEGDRLGGASIFGGDAERSPTVRSGRFQLPPMMVATTEISEIGNGRIPEGFRGEDAQQLASLPESGLDRDVDWDWTVRTWAAPNTFSHPRYFEDRMLERHGHERFPCLQPIASGVRFFGTIPMLPYVTAVRQPCDCEYTLGYYRTGSCAPALKQRPPYERKAVIAGAAGIAKSALILP